jgi:hypothetical protein
MANNPYVTSAVAVAIANAYLAAQDAGTAAVIEIYSGTAPADADATITGTLLASLTCAAVSGTVAASASPSPGVGRLTFAAITSDNSADATGTATHFRIKTQTSGTTTFQGTVGTGTGFDLLLNTASITAGSIVSITSATIDFPEGA